MAQLTGDPLSRVVGHMRSLREAELVIPNKGRGITAPRMTPHDAAALYCVIYASPTIQESAPTLIELKKLESQGRVRFPPSDRPNRLRHLPPLTLGLDRSHSVVDGLAAAIAFFMSEDKLSGQYDEWRGRGKKFGIYSNFEIRAPQFSASLTLGVHGDRSEEWIYGRQGELDSIRTGQCSEITLRKLAACLNS
ncbi:hypothetical protein QA640_42590 [Bradyrhizobium sp. CB82]|uniref:hypothetical protein n=1 Tax=Bradyrhizobium sp. CB82 TaxID=3039159 RepID=UPI0024B19A9C|nr:hypothetical protein [Bradyrhizobium sp. CB82]WFU40772.1 hypothetical protein QA640_42590 [Bradyrhizobium sp. CB82]